MFIQAHSTMISAGAIGNELNEQIHDLGNGDRKVTTVRADRRRGITQIDNGRGSIEVQYVVYKQEEEIAVRLVDTQNGRRQIADIDVDVSADEPWKSVNEAMGMIEGVVEARVSKYALG